MCITFYFLVFKTIKMMQIVNKSLKYKYIPNYDVQTYVGEQTRQVQLKYSIVL